MTIPADLVAPILIAMTVVFSGWMIYEHVSEGKQAGYEADQLSEARKESGDLHRSLLSLTDSLEARIVTLEAPHEHGRHTHELVTASRHQEGGHLVLVKKCAVPGCEHVFRDAQD